MHNQVTVRIPHGLEMDDRGRLGHECPSCGDVFYQDVSVAAEHAPCRYTDHWLNEHRDVLALAPHPQACPLNATSAHTTLTS